MMAKRTPKFDPVIYTSLKSSHLLVYAIYDLHQHDEDISSEDVVSACFTLFPKKFSLKKFPRWPDSALIGRRLHDCRSKRWIAARTDHEVRLTYKGRRLAERTAKALGVKISREKTAGKLQVDKLKPAPKVLKPIVPALPRKRVAKVKVAEAVKPAPVVKLTVSAQGSISTAGDSGKNILPAKSLPAKPGQVLKAKVSAVEAPKAKAPERPTVHRPSPIVKEPKPAPVVKASTPIAKPAPKPKVPVAEKTIVVVEQKPLFEIPVVSAEEKIRAGKFVRMMEASDAYRLYKKNGANAQIGEFDFRSLLLCTMESSPETLARNVELFKGYAGIHNRQDLITFLAFCREKFAHLLLPEKKAVRKLR